MLTAPARDPGTDFKSALHQSEGRYQALANALLKSIQKIFMRNEPMKQLFLVTRSGGNNSRVGNNIIALAKLVSIVKSIKQSFPHVQIKYSFPELEDAVSHDLFSIVAEDYITYISVNANKAKFLQMLLRVIGACKASTDITAPNNPIPKSDSIYSSFIFGSCGLVVAHDLRGVESSRIVHDLAPIMSLGIDSAILVFNDMFPIVDAGNVDIFNDGLILVHPTALDIARDICARLTSNIKLGIHMRKGDYKRWQGGKYYYADSYYQSLMSMLVNLKTLRSMTLVLVSDESIDNQLDLESVFIPSRDASDSANKTSLASLDLLALSVCDVVVGPPSTFSRMANGMSGLMRRSGIDYVTTSCSLLRLTGDLSHDARIIEDVLKRHCLLECG